MFTHLSIQESLNKREEMGDQTDEEYLEIAAGELRKLAASHNIELDAWTMEAIGNIRAGEYTR